MEKAKLIYVYDAYCGWCYGFGPVVKALAEKYQDTLEVDVLSGGMVTGERVHPIAYMAGYIMKTIPRLEQMTGVRFGEPYIALLQEGTYQADSLLPGIALTVFRQWLPQKALAFTSAMQTAFYLEARALNAMETYRQLACEFGLDGHAFTEAMQTEENLRATQQEFRGVQQMGVSGFPFLMHYAHPQVTVLAQGFRPAEELVPIVDQLIGT